jgi:photosystem II stability/assembly factor-like uncharacterized protein
VNTVTDLRHALSEEVRRMQPPAGLEARVLHQALRSSEAVDSAPRAGRRSAIRTQESKSTEAPRLMALVAALLAIAIVVSLVFAARALHLVGSVPASPGPAGPGKLGSQPMLGINMVSPSIGWWGDLDGNLMRTTNGGVHWSDVTPTGPIPLNDYYLDASHAWVVAAPGGLAGPMQLVTLVTVDGGRTWRQGAAVTSWYLGWTPEGKYGPFRQIDLFFVDQMHGWLLVPSQTSQTLYRTSDAGLHWTLVTEASFSQSSGCRWGQMTFASEITGWMTVECDVAPNNGASPLLVTHDGGVTWNAQQLPVRSAGIDCGPLSRCATDCPLTGYIRPWSDGALVHCFGPPVFFDPLHGLLPVWSGQGSRIAQKLLVTADGGATWSVRSLPGQVQLEIDFTDANHLWAVASSSEQLSNHLDPMGGAASFIGPSVGLPLYRTGDGGVTWVPVRTSLSLQSQQYGQFWRVQFLDQSNGFAVYGGTPPLKTTDGGHTWSVV